MLTGSSGKLVRVNPWRRAATGAGDAGDKWASGGLLNADLQRPSQLTSSHNQLMRIDYPQPQSAPFCSTALEPTRNRTETAMEPQWNRTEGHLSL